jgi:hypothetical protein
VGDRCQRARATTAETVALTGTQRTAVDSRSSSRVEP